MVNNDTINEKFIEDILFNVPWIIESGFKIIERQKRIEVGIIDIFGKDNHGRYVVVEIKRDKPDDKVVGQITRYMGFMKEDLKLKEDQIRGIIFCKYTTKNWNLQLVWFLT